MTKTNAPTMKDVAREAGVSLGTVSKVINGITVREEYKKKVEAAHFFTQLPLFYGFFIFSAGGTGGFHFGRAARRARRSLKNACSSSPASSARRPFSTFGWWLKGMANRSVTLPQQPAFASAAPYTTRRMRLLRMAPAHMGQGSSVTNSSHSHSRQPPSFLQAASMASSSAWCRAFFSVSRVLWAADTTSPLRATTAPTGTSPRAAALRASSSARPISS